MLMRAAVSDPPECSSAGWGKVCRYGTGRAPAARSGPTGPPARRRCARTSSTSPSTSSPTRSPSSPVDPCAYSKRTFPGSVIRRSSGSVTAMTAKARTRPPPVKPLPRSTIPFGVRAPASGAGPWPPGRPPRRRPSGRRAAEDLHRPVEQGVVGQQHDRIGQPQPYARCIHRANNNFLRHD